jgi:hypothetical protein
MVKCDDCKIKYRKGSNHICKEQCLDCYAVYRKGSKHICKDKCDECCKLYKKGTKHECKKDEYVENRCGICGNQCAFDESNCGGCDNKIMEEKRREKSNCEKPIYNTKSCKKCNIEKPYLHFRLKSIETLSDGRKNKIFGKTCTECLNNEYEESLLESGDGKRCVDCKKVKTNVKFKELNGKFGKFSSKQCEDCYKDNIKQTKKRVCEMCDRELYLNEFEELYGKYGQYYSKKCIDCYHFKF